SPSGSVHALPGVPQRRAHVRDASRYQHRGGPAIFQAQHARSALPEMHHVPCGAARLEQRSVLLKVNAMLKTILITLSAVATLQAQPVVAPTTEQVGSARGENHANYNITNSFEIGYRWSVVDGDYGEYRSDVNYGNGVRLLSSSLAVDSRDGHGK